MQWRKSFGLFSLVKSSVTSLSRHFEKVLKNSENYCGRYKIKTLGHRILMKTKFLENKGNFSSEEKILAPSFSCYRVSQTHGTVFNCPQGFFSSTVEVIISFLQDLWGCSKHNFLKKRQCFRWGKNYGPLFLKKSSVTNPKLQVVRILKVFSPLLLLL